jgi:hypothetical protein
MTDSAMALPAICLCSLYSRGAGLEGSPTSARSDVLLQSRVRKLAMLRIPGAANTTTGTIISHEINQAPSQ